MNRLRVSLTVPGNDSAFIQVPVQPEGYMLIGCRFSFSSAETGVNMSAPMVVSNNALGVRMINQTSTAKTITGVLHCYFVNKNAIGEYIEWIPS